MAMVFSNGDKLFLQDNAPYHTADSLGMFYGTYEEHFKVFLWSPYSLEFH